MKVMSSVGLGEYSYARAITAAMNNVSGKKEKCLEVEVSDHLRKCMPMDYQPRGGIFVPLSVRASLDSKTVGSGAELVFPQYGDEVIDLLRGRSVSGAMGATIITDYSQPLSFPRVTEDAELQWVTENPGSDHSNSDPQFNNVSLTPHAITGTFAASKALLLSPVADPWLKMYLAALVGNGIDKAAIHGSGTNNVPAGIYSAANVAVKSMGGNPSFDSLVGMIREVVTFDDYLGNFGWATTPGMATQLMKTLIAAGSAPIWTGPVTDGLVAGYKAVASNQVSSALAGGSEHGIIFGNWSHLLIQISVIEIIADPFKLKKQGMVELTGFGLADIALRHPESFCKAAGATIE